MKKELLFLLHLLFFSILNGQINLVKNYGFQFGFDKPVCTYCYCGSGTPPFCTNQNIEADIYDWVNAETEDNCTYCHPIGKKQNCPTSDWVNRDSCPSGLEITGYPKRTASDRFIHLARNGYKRYQGSVDPQEKFYEGVRSTLTQDVQGWTDYILRVKLAAKSSDIGNARSLNVIFSKFGDHWYRKNGNSTLQAGHFTIPANSPHEWYTFETKFSTSIHNQMKQIIVIREKGDDGGYLFVDNVELYEYCTNLMPIQKRLFDSTDLYDINFNPLPMEAKMVHSGSNVSALLPTGEVVCDPLSKVNFKGEWEVRLKTGTRIKRGATFRAYIAPCGVVCPIPSAYVIDDTALCGQANPFHIGGAFQPNTTYAWTSDQAGALAFLDDPSSSDPLFSSPVETSAYGTIKYTLTATNGCGQSQVRNLIISYDNNPVDSPHFEISNIINYDSIAFTLDSIHPKTEKIKVQILACNGVDILEEYEFLNGVDFACCNFNFKYTDWLYPCNCYKIKVSTKNYCFDTWVDTIFNYTTNQSLDFAILSNVGSCNKDQICFKTKGATYIEFDFFNRWGEKVKGFKSDVNDDEMCFRVPDVPSGTYFISGKIIDCNGNYQEFNFVFTVFCSDDLILPPKETTYEQNLNNHTIDASSKSVETTIEVIPERIHYLIYPNPTKKGFSINYNTLDACEAYFTLYNSVGEKILAKKEFISEKSITKNTFFDVSNLASGVYILKFSIGEESFIEKIIIVN